MSNKKRGIGNLGRILLLFILIASLISFSVYSQTPVVTLCVDANYQGICRDFTTGGGSADITIPIELSGKVSSIRVPSGLIAELCKPSLVGSGSCIIFNADDSNLEDKGINDAATKLRIFNGVTLCDGDSTTISDKCENFLADDPDLIDNYVGNDRATYLRLPLGYTAKLCENNNYGGNCIDFQTQQDLPTLIPSPLVSLVIGASSKVSSIKVAKQLESIPPTNTVTVPYDLGCDVIETGAGQCSTCTKIDTIPTDDCTVSVKLTNTIIDDEGTVSTNTGYSYEYRGCSCNCQSESGSGCGGGPPRIPSNQIVNLPTKKGDPIIVSTTAINDCKSRSAGRWGNIIAHFELQKATCNPGFKCDASSGTVQCVVACASIETLCGSNCVNTQTDSNNCGSCGNACSGDNICVNGQCGCSPSSINPTPTVGDVTYSDCSKTEFLYEGTGWKECKNEFWKVPVGSDGREYICAGKGRNTIYECIGDGTAKSGPDGKRLKTGEQVVGLDGKTYYCHKNKKLVTDLDTSDSRETCEAAKFKWTGTKCCSEADDKICEVPFQTNGCPSEFSGCMLENGEGCTEKLEYYNDRGEIGGCWNSTFKIKNDFVINYSVINFKGEFHGCAITKPELAELRDTHNPNSKLIINHTHCLNAPVENYYCSYQGTWNLTNGLDKTHLSFAPLPTELKAECCAVSECWNGSLCIGNQKTKPWENIFGNGIRCIDGAWVQSTIKYNPKGESGFCARDSQCLLNPQAANEIDQCVEQGNYTADDYCENGNWSSRTKQLALKLIKIKNSIGIQDFTIFCDTKENTLNFIQYTIGTSSAASILENDLQANNFCVLSAANKIVIGTSINQNLANAVSKNLFNIKSCSNADSLKDDGQYHTCTDNKLWFNKRVNSIIYSKSGVDIPSEQEQSSFLRNLIKNIIDIIKNIISPPQPDTLLDDSFVKGIKKFDKLYLTQLGSKSISASIEGKGANNKNAVFEYKGFNFDICNFVRQFNETKKQGTNEDDSGIACKNENSNYYVLAQGQKFTKIDPEAIWQDMTSKLRLK